MKIQTSSNGGNLNLWGDVKTIVSVPAGFFVEDFDGIYTAGISGRLIASFAVVDQSND